MIRRFSIETDLNLIRNLNGVRETRRADLQFIRVELQSSDLLEFHPLPMFERLPRNFQIFPDVREGLFTTRVWLNDINTQFNPFVSLVNRVQFDTVTRRLGWQSRFRWIMSPGNDVFLGLQPQLVRSDDVPNARPEGDRSKSRRRF